MDTELERIKNETLAVLREYYKLVQPSPGQILVVGCSTSEVRGARIGTEGSLDVAEAILGCLRGEMYRWEGFLAIQCCEHLNRALVVEREMMEAYALEEVCVHPVEQAGGALAAQARYARIDEVLERGLEPWLQDAMTRLVRLGDAIHRQFMVSTDVTPPVAVSRPWASDQ